MKGLYNYEKLGQTPEEGQQNMGSTTNTLPPPSIEQVSDTDSASFEPLYNRYAHQNGTFYQRPSASSQAYANNGYATGATSHARGFDWWAQIQDWLATPRLRWLRFGISQKMFSHSSFVSSSRPSLLRQAVSWLPVGAAAIGVWYLWTHDFAIPLRWGEQTYWLGTRGGLEKNSSFEAKNAEKLAFLDEKQFDSPKKSNPYAQKVALKSPPPVSATPSVPVEKSTPNPTAETSASWGKSANQFQNVAPLLGSNGTIGSDKTAKYQEYIRRFAPIARVERDKFGIPASIKLAQGILESDAGESNLTRATNNHFGIKTFKSNVPHKVFKDDTPNDKFCVYGSAWESFRAHSVLLMQTNYKSLQFLSSKDYAGWAYGLQRCGYATDPQYAQKLIQIIRRLRLDRYDE